MSEKKLIENTSSTKPSHEYTAHNFEAINRAIDEEHQKQALLTMAIRGQRFESTARTWLYIVSIISLICITGVLTWWLLQSKPSVIKYESFDAPASIKTLSVNQNAELEDASFIDTSYTVFLRNMTDSGDEVVTGKTFLPSNLSQPAEQYCYLETHDSAANLQVIQLAAIDNKELVFETDDVILRTLTKQYCKFSRFN